ncbi:MAG: T9SS type A sorting domain-containing protein [Bacteroidota bacterium]
MIRLHIISLLIFSATLFSQDPGDVHFDYRFGIPGTSYYQTKLCVDPRNGDVYVGGDQFTHAGTVAAKNIAKWVRATGRWEALGSGIIGGNPSPEVKAWVVDPRNGDLYVAGGFTTAGEFSANGLAKWNGTAWSAISGNNYQGITAMTINPNNGDLYVSYGSVTIAGVNAVRIARWDGTKWNPLGAGISSSVNTMIYDAVTNVLLVGGQFNTLDGKMIRGLAKWNGTSWDSVGFSFLNSGATGVGNIYSIALDGVNIYVGCSYVKVGSKLIPNLAKWNGSSWSAVDSLLDTGIGNVTVVNGELFATGVHRQSQSSNSVMSNLARFSNGKWEGLGMISGYASAQIEKIASYQNEVIVAGRQITGAGNVSVKNVARYSMASKEWLALNSLSTLGIDLAYGHYAKANGNLFLAGEIRIPGSPSIQRWTGYGWAPVGRGLYYGLGSNAEPSAMTSGDNGDVYVAGKISFGLNTDSSKVMASSIIKWNGTTNKWEALGTGIFDNSIYSLVYQNGKLYVGGSFTVNSNNKIKNLAVWDGVKWDSITSVGGVVRSIAFAQNGDLVIGGQFTSLANNASLKFLGKWNGVKWDSLGIKPNASVRKILSKGNAIFVSGDFTNIGGKSIISLAKWNGSQWDTVSSAVSQVQDFAFQGDTLFVSGNIAGLGYQFNTGVGYFINNSWTKLGSGFENFLWYDTKSPVAPSRIFVDGGDVWFAGNFNFAGNRPMLGIARWNSAATISTVQRIDENIPARFTLEQNYPNPFNPATIIRFEIQNTDATTLKIYDIVGREVTTLVHEKLNVGTYEMKFDATKLSTGIYFYQLRSGNFVETKKMNFIK